MKRDFPDSETAYPVDGISRGQSGAKPNRPELTSANGAPQGFLTKGFSRLAFAEVRRGVS